MRRTRLLACTAVLALAGALAGPAGAADAADDCAACAGYVRHQPLAEPSTHPSMGGQLSVTLTARLTETIIGGRPARSQVYNGQFPGPTLVVSPGDTLRVHLRNRLNPDYLPYGASSEDPAPIFPGQPYAGFTQPLGNPTNLHVHGMHVSPKSPSDNVLLNINPGEDYRYRYEIPADHPSGLFWYHPHRHEYTDQQVGAGKAGMIIVRGGLDDVPGVGDLPERLLVFQNIEVKDGAVTSSQYQTPVHRLITINGQVQPRLDLRPGETQRWRIANASTERFLSLEPMGGVELRRLAIDGNTLDRPQRITRIWLSPGQRTEVLVRAGSEPGSFALVQQRFNQRPTPYGKQPRVTVATIRIAGAAQAPRPFPRVLRETPQRDLMAPGTEIVRTRRVVLTQSPPKFFVNNQRFMDHGGHASGAVFDVKVGTVEEWVLENKSPEWHNFHIHVNDFQVVARNGEPVPGQPQWFDSIAIRPGHTVTLRLPFDDFDGTWVFHCHVLVHEDHGMMALVQASP
ncbi:MAG: multicopper oxidase family protein [Actinomycetota bacterium]